MNDRPKRLVFDTNVLVSAALFADSVPRRALNASLTDGIVLLSLPLSLELAEVLIREKFDKYLAMETRMSFLNDLLRVVQTIDITETISVCRDPKDDKLLELAVSGRADHLITGDEDLLVLNPFRGVDILTPRQFLDAAVTDR